MRCVVIGRDIRGTAQVVNESGSAVLPVSLDDLSGFAGDAWRPSAGPAITRLVLTSSPAAAIPGFGGGPTASTASRP
jgi:hypothetical protein